MAGVATTIHMVDMVTIVPIGEVMDIIIHTIAPTGADITTVLTMAIIIPIITDHMGEDIIILIIGLTIILTINSSILVKSNTYF